jgi:hypothetical protein
MNLEQAIQKQIDEIMDFTDFSTISEAFRVGGNCWLNKEDDEFRESALRRSCRERLRDASNRCVDRYRKKQISYRGINDFIGDFYEGISDTGCILAECFIYGGDENHSPWVRVNMTCYVERTINDGVEFTEL